jgi:hypothetical protein
MSRVFRAVKPCYIRTFQGQDRPRYYKVGAEFEFDLEFRRDDDGKELVPLFMQEVGKAKASAEPKQAPAQAVSDSSRRLTIQRAVSKLDPEVQDQWTGEGRPAVHAVNTMAGDPNPTITRNEITTFCPTVLRS